MVDQYTAPPDPHGSEQVRGHVRAKIEYCEYCEQRRQFKVLDGDHYLNTMMNNSRDQYS